MCTSVFVGSSAPFNLGPPPTGTNVAPASTEIIPPALRDCKFVAVLRDWREQYVYCSCVFIEESLPWEPKQESEETVFAFAVLKKLAEEHGSNLKVFGCDDTDVGLLPNVHCIAAPKHLHAGGIWFNIPFNGGEPPRILIKIDPDLENPVKPETLDVP